MAFFALLPDWQWKMRLSSFTCGFRTPYFCSNSAGFKRNASATCDTEKIKITIEVASVTIDSGSWKWDVTLLNIDENDNAELLCLSYKWKSSYPEIDTDLTIEIYQLIPHNYLQGMFTDFGIFPTEASSCGSLTSNSCISPSMTISFRHSRPIWLSSASLLQDQIRSFGPAFTESAFAMRIRGRTLCESADFVNLATAREAIMKWFKALLRMVTENLMPLARFWLLLLAFRWHFMKIYII